MNATLDEQPASDRAVTTRRRFTAVSVLLSLLASTVACGPVAPTHDATAVTTSAASSVPSAPDGLRAALAATPASPTVSVFLAAPGRSVAEMASLVTAPLERACQRLAAARDQRSVTGEGAAVIHVALGPDDDPFDALTALRPLVEHAVAGLPEDVEAPILTAHSGRSPRLLHYWLASGERTLEELREIHDEAIEPTLGQLDGVRRSVVCGGALPEVVVELDESRMHAAGISLESVRLAISRAQLPQAGATILRADAGALELGALEDLVIGPSTAGAPILLRDQATIRRVPREADCRAYGPSGREGIMGTLHVAAGADPRRARGRLRAATHEIRSTLPSDLSLAVVASPTLDPRATSVDMAWAARADAVPAQLVAWLVDQPQGSGQARWFLQLDASDEMAWSSSNRARLFRIAPAEATGATTFDLARVEEELTAIEAVHLRGAQIAPSLRRARLLELRILYDSDRGTATRVASDVAELAASVTGVRSAWLPDANPAPTISYPIDPRGSRLAGLRPGQIARAARARSGGLVAGRVRIGQRHTAPLRVVVRPASTGLSALPDVTMLTPSGKLVRLGDVATIQLSAGQPPIRRHNQRGYVAVELFLDRGQQAQLGPHLRRLLPDPLPVGLAAEWIVAPGDAAEDQRGLPWRLP
jgi:multidrug efflux pump subunit AcrB